MAETNSIEAGRDQDILVALYCSTNARTRCAYSLQFPSSLTSRSQWRCTTRPGIVRRPSRGQIAMIYRYARFQCNRNKQVHHSARTTCSVDVFSKWYEMPKVIGVYVPIAERRRVELAQDIRSAQVPLPCRLQERSIRSGRFLVVVINSAHSV